jgi:hypothetical protein
MAQVNVADMPITGNPFPVPFHGSTLFVVPVNEEPFTPMKPIVEGMGLDWRAQAAKFRSNKERWGVVMIATPSDGGQQDAVCLPVRKLPAWMASINPKKVREEIRPRVILYQNECDDALWAYWTKGRVERPAQPTGSLTPDQQQHIRNLVAARAKALPHGGGFPQIWERVKNRFGAARYQDIPAAQFEAVVEYLLKMEVKQEPKALAPSALALGSFDMLTVSPESAAFEHDRDVFTRACYNALAEKRFALKKARFGGKNQRAAAEMLLQEIRLLEIQYEAATSSAHAFAHTLYQADRLTKIAGVL